jgi:hypothetical protein
MLASELLRAGNMDDRRTVHYGVSNTARPVESRNQTMHSALEAFERRMSRRIYAVGLVILVAEALIRHFLK